MLVLTRRLGEGILVGDAFVQVLHIENGQVKIGVDAPPEIEVLREELVTFELSDVPAPRSPSAA